jgi:hypothetical protein
MGKALLQKADAAMIAHPLCSTETTINIQPIKGHLQIHSVLQKRSGSFVQLNLMPRKRPWQNSHEKT